MHVEGVLANNDYILNGCYIEITSNCNLRCIHCYNESGELRDQISVEAFKNVLGCYDNPKKASITLSGGCLLYTSPSPRDATLSRMPSSA